MSRMVPDFDEWLPPEDKAATVRRVLGKAGISLDAATAPSAPPAPGPSTAARLAALAERDGFLTPPNSFTISPALAAQLHYRPKMNEPAEKARSQVSDDDGYEGMRR